MHYSEVMDELGRLITPSPAFREYVEVGVAAEFVEREEGKRTGKASVPHSILYGVLIEVVFVGFPAGVLAAVVGFSLPY